MTITTTQKVIKIGTSRGVTLPAKELRRLGAKEGDEIQIVVNAPAQSSDTTVLETANALIDKYKKDFENLAKR